MSERTEFLPATVTDLHCARRGSGTHLTRQGALCYYEKNSRQGSPQENWITISDKQSINSECMGTKALNPQQHRPLQQLSLSSTMHTSDRCLLFKGCGGTFIFTLRLFCNLQILKSNPFKLGKVLFKKPSF